MSGAGPLRGDREEPYTPTALTAEIRGVLGATFGDVWVRAELSQVREAASGHVYLTLKDEGAVLPAVIWRSTAARLRGPLEDGMEVLVAGGLDVHPPHGKYQFIVRRLEPVGLGALQRAFEALRRRLEAEGLFAEARKKALPLLPRCVAIVTSPGSAALKDFVRVARDRHPGIDLVVVPVRVQGEGSAAEIASAIARVAAAGFADVLVVARGGGSLEDLWSFNEEVVVRAIAAAHLPVVSGVGHETDVTLADLAADVRAATPSNAAERVVPDRTDLARRLSAVEAVARRALRRRLDRAWQRVEALGERPVLATPRRLLDRHRHALARAAAALDAHRPRARLDRLRARIEHLSLRLAAGLPRRVAERTRDLDVLAARLHALSPLAVLGRGYALLERVPDEAAAAPLLAAPRLVRGVAGLAPGDLLRARLGDGGSVEARVERTQPGHATGSRP